MSRFRDLAADCRDLATHFPKSAPYLLARAQWLEDTASAIEADEREMEAWWATLTPERRRQIEEGRG